MAKFFWVFQKDNQFERERDYPVAGGHKGHVCAVDPECNRHQNVRTRVKEIRKGDFILHGNSGSCGGCKIRAISIALDEYNEQTGREHYGGHALSWQVPCDYVELDKPLSYNSRSIKNYLMSRMKKIVGDPFNRCGTGNPGYCFCLDKETAAFFINEISKNNPAIASWQELHEALKA